MGNQSSTWPSSRAARFVIGFIAGAIAGVLGGGIYLLAFALFGRQLSIVPALLVGAVAIGIWGGATASVQERGGDPIRWGVGMLRSDR